MFHLVTFDNAQFARCLSFSVNSSQASGVISDSALLWNVLICINLFFTNINILSFLEGFSVNLQTHLRCFLSCWHK